MIPRPMWKSTKTFEHVASAAFRQHKALSHCRLIHGYALTFKFVFGSTFLDAKNWVVDFGSLKTLKQEIERTFDHKLIISFDDPEKLRLIELEKVGAVAISVLPEVGCESFAKVGFEMAMKHVPWQVQVLSCEVFEHGANSAIYEVEFDHGHANS